ncbi:MAG: lytic transglycosylase domain-containing protein [Ruminiclostridium sp.]|nr:lytic transglycosylase domain-containing protein [Ruminiclostridium sp.]
MRKSKKTAIGVFIGLVLAAAAIAAVVIGYRIAETEIKRATHPLMYSEYVEKYAEEYGMDKYVIYAAIKTESGFDPNAVSSTGARGLMQLMENSFDWVKFRLGDGDDVTFEDMFDPETNIRYGAYLLDYLNEYFGCPETASAAYFSGVGTVSEWVKDPDISSDGIHLDNIPSKNAAHYVSKIKNALDAYYELYATERK